MGTSEALQVLGLSSAATREDIKRAFHRLAHQHHPDKGGDAEKFKKISAAYAVLRDYSAPGEPAATSPGANFFEFNGQFYYGNMSNMARAFDEAMEEVFRENQKREIKRFEEMQAWMKRNGVGM